MPRFLAHLWLVPNPEYNAKGDFSLQLDPKANDANADIGLALSLPLHNAPAYLP